jgi:fatty acid desaturase
MSGDALGRPRSTAPRRVFAHSIKDAWLVSLALTELALIVGVAVTFDRLPGWGVIVAAALAIFLNCTNFQCIAHNFVHTPFFARDGLRCTFSVFNSLILGLPQTLYRYHHLNHHAYNNDAPDPVTGTTRDLSSTYRFSRRPGRPESLVTYALLGPLRGDVGALYAEAGRHRETGLVWAEVTALVGFSAALIVFQPLFAAFLLPTWYLGHVAAYAENYLEHHGAIPGNRLTDSVSSYGRAYNLIWFNNGYHQEHHYRPQVHWSRVPALRAEMLPESARRVVKHAHWFNF